MKFVWLALQWLALVSGELRRPLLRAAVPPLLARSAPRTLAPARSGRRLLPTLLPLARARASGPSPRSRTLRMSEDSIDLGKRLQEYWNNATEFVGAFKPIKLSEDDLPEAVALNDYYNYLEREKLAPDLVVVGNLTSAYVSAGMQRVFDNPAVKDRLPAVFTFFNAGLALVVLRLFLPRLLAITSMQELGDFGSELGLPSKEELQGYLEYANNLNYATKLAVFLGIFTAEKITLIGEFIPVGLVLPAISPALFGGVLEGTVISAACSAVASSANFALARTFLKEKALEAEIMGQPPVGDADWYKALSRNIEKDGFKSMLLLRLAPVLPIPIDAHWYVCGLTPLKLWEFLAGFFVGALKITFFDAFFGDLLINAAAGEDLGAGSQGIIVAETAAIVTTSLLVSSFANQVVLEMMDQEGFNTSALENSAGKGAESEDQKLTDRRGSE